MGFVVMAHMQSYSHFKMTIHARSVKLYSDKWGIITGMDLISDLSGLGIGKWEMGFGKWDLGNGKWELGIGNWEMGNGIWDLRLSKKQVKLFNQRNILYVAKNKNTT